MHSHFLILLLYILRSLSLSLSLPIYIVPCITPIFGLYASFRLLSALCLVQMKRMPHVRSVYERALRFFTYVFADNLVARILCLHLFQLSTFPCGWTCVQSQVMVILLNQIWHQWLHCRCTDTKYHFVISSRSSFPFTPIFRLFFCLSTHLTGLKSLM